MRLSVFRLFMSKFYSPPPHVRGMKILDREVFSREFLVPCVRIPKIDGPRHNQLIKQLTPFLLKIQKAKTILNSNDTEGAEQTILIDEGLLLEKDVQLPSLVSEFHDYCQIDDHTLRLNYEHWPARVVLNSVLPVGEDAAGQLTSSSYSQMGHIVHVNLREDLLEYKHLIGDVLLEKILSCRTVVNKLDMVEGQFRTLNFELLAGEPDYVCQTQENDCKYKFDFSKVFWNTRLSTEHKRLVDLFKYQQIVYDVCAGVGPFAIPAAKKKVAVIANDLNPDCVDYLQQNAELNGVRLQGVHCMDGPRFITEVAGPDLIRRIVETNSDLDDAPITTGAHFIMNLPAMAVEFLPSFVGLLRGIRGKEISLAEGTVKKRIKLDCETGLLPVCIHCYTFIKGDESYKLDDYKAKGVEKVKEFLKDWELHDLRVHNVRNVAPNKQMLCISFRADERMLLAEER